MARIPSILADKNLRATPQSPSAQPVDSGFGALAGGLMNASQAAETAMAAQAQIDSKRQNAIDAQWEGDSLFQEANYLNKWQSEHSTDPDYAEAFLKHATERIKTYEEATPSKRAKANISQRLKSFVASRYDQALGVTERNRMEGAKESVISQTSFALGNLRTSKNLPGVDVLREAETSRLDILRNIEGMFPNSPETVRKLSAYTDAEMALGMAPLDKELAQDTIKNSKHIEESDKPTLLYKIDVLSKAQDQANLDSTNRTRRDHLATVEAGNARGKLPLSLYSVYDNPAQEKEKDDFKIDVYNDVHDYTVKIAPLNSAATARELNKLQKNVSSERQKLVLDALGNQMIEIGRMREKDRANWLRTYNPEIRALEQQMIGLDPNDVQYKSLSRQVFAAMDKYQGFAPTGAKDADLYLGLATNDRTLMSKEEAARSASQINQGTGDDAVSRLNQVLAQFPDLDQQMIAFNDMVGTTDGIKPEYQLLWQNKDQWFASSYAKALSDAKSLAKLSDETKNKFSDAINANPTWIKFEHAARMAGRIEEAAGFKSGIMTYANYLQGQNQSKLETAVNDSVNHLLSSTLGFTSVNGRSLMVYKPTLKQTKRTDDDINDLGRRLGVSLRHLDPREVNQEKFTGLQIIHPDEFNTDRLQALRDVITRTGFYVNENDGQSVTLFVVGNDGIPFQLRDRDNKAFQIFFDEVPDWWRDPGTEFTDFLLPLRGQFSGLPGKIQVVPEKTYPLREGYNESVNWFDKILGWPEKQTHWPTTIFKRKGPE